MLSSSQHTASEMEPFADCSLDSATMMEISAYFLNLEPFPTFGFDGEGGAKSITFNMGGSTI